MEFGQRVKKLRIEAGLTQEDIAKKLGLSKTAVGAWENGRAKPRLDKMNQLSDLFGVPVSELLGERQVVGSSKLVPLVGYTHMGDVVDEDTCDRMVEVPTSVAEAHPSGYCVHADGGCMDNRYPTDCVLMVDPDMEPRNGCAVLAEVEGYRSVVRTYLRGASTLVLSPDSHSGAYEDIVIHAGDEPVALKGVVVWYQAEKDVRGKS